MRKTLLSLALLCLTAATALADLPFRNHRYSSLSVLQPNSESIVFVGNSITNMHEWWEAFGNAKVLNRGCSGAVTDEMLDNLETILVGHPAKIFFMMGTNDLGTSGINTPEHVARNVRAAVRRCKAESPTTQIYVQSILPCTGTSIKNTANVPIANDSIKNICAQLGATYVDLYDDLAGIPTYQVSKDGTHLTAAGYRIWCKKIAQYVGSDCVYLDSSTDNACGLNGIHGERATYFGFMPVKADDILMIGDGTINGGEWHELLHSDKVKTRATNWGGAGTPIATMQSMLPNIFDGRTDNVDPAKVFIQMGYNEAANSTAKATAIDAYKTFVDKVRELAPTSKIYLQAIYPSNNASVNTNYIVPFNAALDSLAQTMDNVEYVAETYTSLVKDGVANTEYFNSYYLYGKGYAKYAQAVAPYMGAGVTAITDDEAAAHIATFAARKALAAAIATAEDVEIGTGAGQYPADKATPLTTAISEAYTLLATDGTTDETLTAKATAMSSVITEVLPAINQPTLSTDGAEVWYQLYTPNRESRYLTSQGVGQSLLGGNNTGYARTMWKFVQRTDGSLDIINRKDGSYIDPAATYNTAVKTSETQPASGWTLGYSNAAGLYIVSSGKVELNQTQSGLGYAVYNWSSGESGTDRSDTGCQYAIVLAGDPIEEPVAYTKGVETISLSTGAYANPSGTYNKTWTSTRTAPQITFTCPANNMEADGTDLSLNTGSAQSATYTLAVESGYVIVDYSFTAVNKNSHGESITITAAGTTYNSSNDGVSISQTGVKSQSVTFTIAGTNGKPVTLRDFKVTVAASGHEDDNIDEAPETFTKGQEDISLTTGAYANPSGTYNKSWTSTRTAPQITFTCPANNMEADGDYLSLNTGSSGGSTYTLAVDNGYVIVDYSLTAANKASHGVGITIKAGDNSYTSTDEGTTISVTGIKTSSTTFSISGTNLKPVTLRDFKVTIAAVGHEDDDINTAISTIDLTNSQNAKASNHYYNLSGRRIQGIPAQKGIYVVNGKKVLVK